MRRLPVWVVVVATILAWSGRRSLAQTDPLEVHFTLSKSEAMLGEPLWVQVTVTNRSNQTVPVDWGADCPVFGSKAIDISIPDATQGDGETKPCPGGAGNCMMPLPEQLEAGATSHRIYPLVGDFHITQPGHYTVVVKKTLAKRFYRLSELENERFPQAWKTERLELNITPPYPAQLLELEEEIVQEATRPNQSTFMNTAPNLGLRCN